MTRNVYNENPLYIKIIERNDSRDNSNDKFQLWRKDQSLRIPEIQLIHDFITFLKIAYFLNQCCPEGTWVCIPTMH